MLTSVLVTMQPDTITSAEPHPVQSGESATPNSANRAVLIDAVVVFSLAILICALFWKTVALGMPLSKVSRLTHWDTLFEQFRSGPSGLMDPSLVQLMIPYYFFVAKTWHTGQVPLWNQLSGCGIPLLADPQAEVFSPLHALIAFLPSMRVYNLTLLVELWLGAAGTYLFSRALRVNIAGSILAATAFTFCPFLDWFLELIGSGYMMYPLVFWLFTRSVKQPTLASAVVSGVSIATMVLSGHPEVSLFGVSSAVLFAFALLALGAVHESLSLTNRLLIGVKQTAIAAFVSFGLAAVILVPFGEYLLNGDTYKLAGKAIPSIPFQALALNLFQPAFGGASLYLGILPLLCLPFAVKLAFSSEQSKRPVIALLACSLLLEAYIAAWFPFNILTATVLHSIIPNYCQPAVLLMLSVAAGMGWQSLTRANSKWVVMFFAAVAFAVVAPLLVRILHAPLDSLTFDTSLQAAALGSHDWNKIAMLTGGIAALITLGKACKGNLKWVPFGIAMMLSFAGLFAISAEALPPQGQFDYPATKLTTYLNHLSSRYLATGQHLLKPNTNIVYGMKDLRFHNPIFPKRYRSFLQTCGATQDDFNQIFNPPLSPLVGLANVEHILTMQPLWSDGFTEQAPLRPPTPNVIWKPARVVEASYIYDPQNRQLVGTLRWQIQSHKAPLVSLVTGMDASQEVLWFTERQPLPQKGKFEQKFGIAINDAKKLSQPILIGLQLFDDTQVQFLKPQSQTNLKNDTICKLLEFVPATIGSKAGDHDKEIAVASDMNFKLSSSSPFPVRIYNVPASVPQAYLATDVHNCSDEKAALKYIQRSDFDYRKSAVVENAVFPSDWDKSSSEPIKEVTNGKKPNGAKVGTAANKDPNRVSTPRVASEPGALRDADGFHEALVDRPSGTVTTVKTDSERSCLLVLTDTFYPGWNATVDGKPTVIVRTNYLFRGVFVPSGQHTVEFTYAPQSFRIGLIISVAAVLGLLFFFTFLAIGSLRKAHEQKGK